MRLDVRQSVAAPKAAVFAAAADFDGVIEGLSGRGIELRRADGAAGDPLGAGAAWRGQVDVRGVTGPAELHLTEWQPPEAWRLSGRTPALAALADMRVAEPATGLSEVRLTIDVASRSFAGRLLLQSLKLARGAIEARLQDRLARAAARLEAAHR